MLAESANGHPSGGLTGAGSLQRQTQVAVTIFDGTREIGVSRARYIHWRYVFVAPVGPVSVIDLHRDGCACRLAVEHAARKTDRVLFNTHATTAAESLLAAAHRSGGSESQMIQVRGLVKSFGDHTVLKEINLDVVPGERLALVGPNGAGKTTLLRILAALSKPTAGIVRIAGRDARSVIAVPLRFADEIIGFVYLERGIPDRPFGRSALNLAVALIIGFALSVLLGHFWGGIPLEILLSMEYFTTDSLVAFVTGISVALFMGSKS